MRTEAGFSMQNKFGGAVVQSIAGRREAPPFFTHVRKNATATPVPGQVAPRPAVATKPLSAQQIADLSRADLLDVLLRPDAETRLLLQYATKREGFVYFVQAVDGGPIKIGTTQHAPSYRLAGLQGASPVALRMLGAVVGGAAVERVLHARFAEHRLHGEWFAEHPTLLEFIAALPTVTVSKSTFIRQRSRRMASIRAWKRRQATVRP